MQVMSWTPEDLVFEEEYNVRARRLFPWSGVPDLVFSGAWIAVDPGSTSTPHAHDLGEMFFIFEGQGEMRIGDERRLVKAGETIFIPPHHEHSLANLSDRRLVFLTIWWDWARALATPA